MNAATLITAYYDAFNRGDREAMLSMLTDDVAHDLNQGAREVGREAFRLMKAQAVGGSMVFIASKNGMVASNGN